MNFLTNPVADGHSDSSIIDRPFEKTLMLEKIEGRRRRG